MFEIIIVYNEEYFFFCLETPGLKRPVSESAFYNRYQNSGFFLPLIINY